MNKRKPYYIVIAALCFASIISFFLPFLHLPEQEGVSTGYTYDSSLAALESNIINDVAKESGIAKKLYIIQLRILSMARIGRPSKAD